MYIAKIRHVLCLSLLLCVLAHPLIHHTQSHLKTYLLVVKMRSKHNKINYKIDITYLDHSRQTFNRETKENCQRFITHKTSTLSHYKTNQCTTRSRLD